MTVIHGHGEAAVRALGGVDLEIVDGESVGLLGPSGSGKTTLLHVLGGLITPASGTVAWRGEELVYPRSRRSWPGIRAGRRLCLPGGEPAAQPGRAREHRIRDHGRRAPRSAASDRNGSGTPETPDDYLALVGLEGKVRSFRPSSRVGSSSGSPSPGLSPRTRSCFSATSPRGTSTQTPAGEFWI